MLGSLVSVQFHGKTVWHIFAQTLIQDILDDSIKYTWGFRTVAICNMSILQVMSNVPAA